MIFPHIPKTRKTIMEAKRLIGNTKEELYSILGSPDYSEFGDTYLVYIVRRWLVRKAVVIDLDLNGVIENAYTVSDF